MKKLILFATIIAIAAACQPEEPQPTPPPVTPPTSNSMHGNWILKERGMITYSNGQPVGGTTTPYGVETYNFSGDGKVYLVASGLVQTPPQLMGTHNGINTYRQNGFAYSDSFALVSLNSQTMVLEQLGLLKPESNYNGNVWRFVYERP